MIWVVINENPWPDKYIPVLVRPSSEWEDFKKKSEKYVTFNHEKMAIEYAFQLKEKFNTEAIRIFYYQGPSQSFKEKDFV